MGSWLRFYPGGRRLCHEAANSARERLGDLRDLSESEIGELPECTDEEVELTGHTVARITWHETKEDGSHWVVVQVWGTGFILGSFMLAQEGFACSPGSRRELEVEELLSGGFD